MESLNHKNFKGGVSMEMPVCSGCSTNLPRRLSVVKDAAIGASCFYCGRDASVVVSDETTNNVKKEAEQK